MSNTHARRRRREKPIRRISRAARSDLSIAETETGITATEAEAKRLVGEATHFADPFFCPGRDALLPVNRGDVRQEFFRRCLRGEASSTRERFELAREIAPIPGGSAAPTRFSIRAMPPTYGEALQAFRAQRRRLGRLIR